MSWAPLSAVEREQRRGRVAALKEALGRRILVLDGATGTQLQNRGLKAADFGGAEYEGCNEHLVLTRPDVIEQIHEAYLAAGADIIETNTFGGTPLVLAEYGLAARTHEINLAAARIARSRRGPVRDPGPPALRRRLDGADDEGDLGHRRRHLRRARRHLRRPGRAALVEGGVDYLLLETSQDTRNVKAALLGIDRAFADLGEALPVAVSGTIEPMGTMLAGQSVEALATSLEHRDLLYLGLNCATGPEFMTDHVRSLAALTRFPVACVPNAGLPDENGPLPRDAGDARAVARALRGGGLGEPRRRLLRHHDGAHRRARRGGGGARCPRPRRSATARALSGIDYLEVDGQTRPVIVGERTNVIGSKKFKELIVAEQFEEAAEIARAQVKRRRADDRRLPREPRPRRAAGHASVPRPGGPQGPGAAHDRLDRREGPRGGAHLLPGQGDHQLDQPRGRRGALRAGRPARRGATARRSSSAASTRTSRAWRSTAKRKLAIAERSPPAAHREVRHPRGGPLFDPLVFPCATGDAQLRRAARSRRSRACG